MSAVPVAHAGFVPCDAGDRREPSRHLSSFSRKSSVPCHTDMKTRCAKQKGPTQLTAKYESYVRLPWGAASPQHASHPVPGVGPPRRHAFAPPRGGRTN